MKNYYISVLVLLFFLPVSAQYRQIIKSGTIIFDYQINQYERAKKILGQEIYTDRYQNFIHSLENNRFINREYKLSFNIEHTKFELNEYSSSLNYLDFLIGIQTTNVFVDFVRDSIYFSKISGEDKVMIQDNRIPITWKFTTERMEILGYECRRANGLIMDSIYVVAFYCPDIAISGGPSIFSGLPGMILGISLPQDHINIFATRIETLSIPSTSINSIPNLQRKMSFIDYKKYIEQTFSYLGGSRLGYNMRAIYF